METYQELSIQYTDIYKKKYNGKYDLEEYDVIFPIKYFTDFINSMFTQIIAAKTRFDPKKGNIKPTRERQ